MNLEDRVNEIFWSKYTRYPLPAPGNLGRVENLIREDIIDLVKSLEKEIEELKEYKWMYEGLSE